ncbi:ABC transporter type 1, transmembrane domain-containing protein [Pisolithus croceorrhizus]|nr:ABC transporter type 1, transmembrane domain-containing protein [Pisolithus croceorrhizus]
MSWSAQLRGLGPWQLVLPSSPFVAFNVSTDAAQVDSLTIPFYLAVASAILLVLHVVASTYPVRVLQKCVARIVCPPKRQGYVDSDSGFAEYPDLNQPLVVALGGALYSLLAEKSAATAGWSQLPRNFGRVEPLLLILWIVLLTLFSDLHEGRLLWAKLAILTSISIILPVMCPTQYIPVDPEDPYESINPEQTASWLSFSLYTWLDPVVVKAQRVSHLSRDQLPPLADYDCARNLRKRNFPHVDAFASKRKQHLFIGLMRVFRTEYATLTLLVILRVISTLAAPVGINKLLEYLETGGIGATVRPWVWIVVIFTRAIVHTECIITQLVFEHALRIRIKAEVPDSDNGPTDSTVTTPDSASVSESATAVEGSREGSPDEGQHSTTDTTTGGKSVSSTENFVGKINNLITTDLGNITDGRDFLLVFPYVPLQLVLCTWFLYHILDWSAFVGLAVMILLFPLPGMVAKKIQTVQRTKMEKTDARVQTVTETMNALRMVKLFGWEKKMNERIYEKREVELVWTWKYRILDLANNTLNFIIPLFTMMACYATYTVVMGKQLTASRVFSSMTVFDIMRGQLSMIFWMVPPIIQAKVSLGRINDFLNNTELLDGYALHREDQPQISPPEVRDEDSEVIGFRDAVFTWSNESNGTSTRSRRKFKLRTDVVLFKQGCINIVVGPTGSGKTSLLMALLGEMHFVPTGPNSWYNLPRRGGVAYAPQESWVQNETIRDNILFGAAYDEARYKKVVYQCALERDLELFKAGDRTEVGEKGLTLSGGQKARVTLARAVYSDAEILLLDDVLAALDVHTSKWIVEKCFAGDLLKNRTVILVTHNVAVGLFRRLLPTDDKLAAEVAKEQEGLEREEEVVDTAEQAPQKKGDGKLVLQEEILEGRVSWSALSLYFANLGGGHTMLFWFAFLFLIAATEVINVVQTWFLGYWASQYEHRLPSEVNVKFYLSVYGALLLLGSCLYIPGYILYYQGTLRASRAIHKKLVEAVLGTTLRWLDMTPTSRVITRCTQDIRAIDGPFAQELSWVIELTITLLFKLGAVVLFTPLFLLPGVLVGVVGIWVGRVYMKAQLSVKREMSNAKAPVLGHFGAAIAGLTSIRAYGAQDAFRRQSLERIDYYSRSARTFYNLNRWVCIRIDLVGALFTGALAAYLVYGRTSEAGNVGFSLNMAIGFSSMILYWVRILNNAEVDGNSVERINSYINIEQEPQPSEGGQPPAHWPTSGDLAVEKLSARYSVDGPKVLHDLSFHVKSGERVGIVGRTGSGKPELLSGTLRQNLDPFDQHDDATLNNALRSAVLLQGVVAILSVGQRQIIALARAMVRGSKLLILDEGVFAWVIQGMAIDSFGQIIATSAIDYKTDTVIQTSLRHEMRNVTQLIVAHRLQTIMDADKIMVLDAGRIVEFGSPNELLRNEQGSLRALVDQSGDKDALYGMTDREEIAS